MLTKGKSTDSLLKGKDLSLQQLNKLNNQLEHEQFRSQYINK